MIEIESTPDVMQPHLQVVSEVNSRHSRLCSLECATRLQDDGANIVTRVPELPRLVRGTPWVSGRQTVVITGSIERSRFIEAPKQMFKDGSALFVLGTKKVQDACITESIIAFDRNRIVR